MQSRQVRGRRHSPPLYQVQVSPGLADFDFVTSDELELAISGRVVVAIRDPVVSMLPLLLEVEREAWELVLALGSVVIAEDGDLENGVRPESWRVV